MDYKDKASKDFMVALEKMRLEAVRLFSKLKDKLTAVELQAVIASPIKMKEFVLKELGFQGELNKLMVAYAATLKATTMFAPVNEVTLQALMNLEKASWANKALIEISALQKEFLKASITGEWKRKTIIDNLELGLNNALTRKQIETEVTTALSTFNRNVNTAMMVEMPSTEKYVYIGILDGVTRDYGLEMMEAGALTMAEIESRYSDSLSGGCGFNCRGHHWSIITPEFKNQSKQAKKEIKTRDNGKK